MHPQDHTSCLLLHWLHSSENGTTGCTARKLWGFSPLIYNDHLFLLLNFGSSRKKQELLAGIQSKLAGFGVSAGVSVSFASLSELSVFWKQALETRRIGEIMEPETPVHEAEHLLPYLLFADKDRKELAALTSLEYLALVNYDQANGTDVTKTVITYFETGFDIQKTAELLHLHRNTVSYRINTICRNLDIDISDFKTQRAIQLSELISLWLSING